jgi:hypothetical protein
MNNNKNRTSLPSDLRLRPYCRADFNRQSGIGCAKAVLFPFKPGREEVKKSPTTPPIIFAAPNFLFCSEQVRPHVFCSASRIHLGHRKQARIHHEISVSFSSLRFDIESNPVYEERHDFLPDPAEC